jgi:uncharacterized protein YkwD
MTTWFKHFFLPHHTNNQRAKLLHFDTILLIAIIFFVASFFVPTFTETNPQILVITINISTQDLLTLTNQQRVKVGLLPLKYNSQLAQAAADKAKDMFTDNYWAHISPTTQKTPWIFIQNAGYKYIYAGENLARGYTTAPDVINAWMASPSHKENILSPNYEDIGFAIQEGNLTGEKDTILVVEMFGNQEKAPPLGKSSGQETQIALAKKALANETQQNQVITTSPAINRITFAKNITQALLMLFIGMFILDFLFIEQKKISRLVGHNLDHILFLIAILVFIIIVGTGSII